MKKKSHSAFNKAQLVTAGKKKYTHYYEFAKKDAIIKYIEISGVSSYCSYCNSWLIRNF